jgi:hypothetical protein
MMRRLLFAMLTTLTLVQPAAAQRSRGGSPSQQPSRAELERRLRENYEQQVRERLGLDEEQARELNEAVMQFQEERLALQRRESALKRRLEGQGATGRRGGAVLADNTAREVLQEMLALENDETSLFNREQERLLELLTPSQLVSYYLLREQFAETLRRARSPGRGRS